MMDRRIGAQLYTVRDLCKNEKGFEDTISRLSKIGYKTVQVSGIGPIAPEKIKSICDSYNMQIVCTHKSFDEYTKHCDEMIKYHKTIDCKIAGLGSRMELADARSTNEVIDEINKLNEIYDRLADAGIEFCYHNHAFEFMKFDSKYLMDYMLEYGKFGFIVDVYWLAYAAQNPADFIRKIGKRARVVHFKDLRMNKNQSEFAEVMEGNLDWQDIISACDEAGTEAAMVEQDICHLDPVESLKISYNNLKTLGFN